MRTHAISSRNPLAPVLAPGLVLLLVLPLAGCSSEPQDTADAAVQAADDNIAANAATDDDDSDSALDEVEARMKKAAQQIDADADKAGDKIEQDMAEAERTLTPEAQ